MSLKRSHHENPLKWDLSHVLAFLSKMVGEINFLNTLFLLNLIYEFMNSIIITKVEVISQKFIQLSYHGHLLSCCLIHHSYYFLSLSITIISMSN